MYMWMNVLTSFGGFQGSAGYHAHDHHVLSQFGNVLNQENNYLKLQDHFD